jgi:hypothetical protein
MSKKKQEYSFLLGLEKTITRVIIIAGPILVGLLPEAWMNVTLGAAIIFAINWAKNR